MKHRINKKKLNRDIKHRKALFKNLINALVIHEEIQTTESKAKAIKGLVDKLINNGKKGTLHARKTIAAFLQNKVAVNKIVEELGPRFSNRVSGFTRTIRLGERRGDDAMMVKMEFVEKKKTRKEDKKAETKKKTQSNKRSKAKKKKTKSKKKTKKKIKSIKK